MTTAWYLVSKVGVTGPFSVQVTLRFAATWFVAFSAHDVEHLCMLWFLLVTGLPLGNAPPLWIPQTGCGQSARCGPALPLRFLAAGCILCTRVTTLWPWLVTVDRTSAKGDGRRCRRVTE